MHTFRFKATTWIADYGKAPGNALFSEEGFTE
jgi:hypothetical protein